MHQVLLNTQNNLFGRIIMQQRQRKIERIFTHYSIANQALNYPYIYHGFDYNPNINIFEFFISTIYVISNIMSILRLAVVTAVIGLVCVFSIQVEGMLHLT